MVEIKVRDLTDTSSVTLDNKLMVLTNSTINKVQNITIEDYITNLISTKANNVLTKGDDNKLYVETPESITGELSDLTTTDKTTLVNAINEVKGDAGNLADLSNLTETGEERLHALKSYSDNGELLTDAEGLEDVTNYAHSTFDSSKFTPYGSPIINNGIATGLDGSNGIYVPTLTPGTSSWEIGIEQEVTTEAIADTNTQFVFFTDGADKGVNVQCKYDNSSYDHFFAYAKGVETSLTCNSAPNGKCVAGDIQKLVLGYDAPTNIAYFKAYKNGVLYASSSGAALGTLQQDAAHNTIGFRRTSRGTKNKIDLKTYYVKIDGVLVYNGNKTGIDTIKADDWTAVDSPVISADGMYDTTTSSTNSHYIYKSMNLGSYTNSFKICGKSQYKTGTSQTAFWIAGTLNPRLIFSPNNTQGLQLYDTAGQAFSINPTGIYNGCFVEYEITYTTTSVLYKITVDGTVIKEDTVTRTNGTTIATSSQRISFGSDTYGQAPILGLTDLNTCKIYVDGNLVYQPCLKIPYTESKTGSKVVNSVYRDRVNDMAEQFGSAPYYTLSDTDFTLPQGELYGLIEKTKGNLSVPAYGNQDIGVTISSDTFTYTCPDDGYIYCNNIQVSAGGAFELSISRNGQSSYLILFGGASVDSSVQIPFIYPVKKGDVVQTLWSSTASTYPTLYFVPKEGV